MYGDSSYWAAYYRIMTEGTVRMPAGPVEDTRKSLSARDGTLVARLFARRRPPVGSPEERSR
jgi:hypothetical protein